MFAIIITVVAIFVCNIVATPTDGRSSRIIGGQIARDEQFPHQVSLRYYNNAQHFCGGSIISENWILTAANCITMLNPSEIIVVVGTNYLTTGGLSYYVDIVRKHESFNPTNNLHDIAVLHLRNPILLSTKAKIIPLSDFATQGGLYGLFSGWGMTSYPSTILSDALHYITLRTITVGDCKLYLDGVFPITFSHVCTLVPSGKGLCTGDAGGPLVVNEEQHGISIWGVPCGKGYPDVFTSVSYYRTWIKDITSV